MPLPGLNPDFRDMLGLLLKHRVEFVVIGAYALAAHRRPRNTGDIDFYVRPSPENARRVWRALAEFGAPLGQLAPQDFEAPRRVVQFGVEPCRIDFTTSLTGIEGFDEVWANRIHVEIEGMSVPVLGKSDLIRNKRATARKKDLADLDELDEGAG